MSGAPECGWAVRKGVILLWKAGPHHTLLPNTDTIRPSTPDVDAARPSGPDVQALPGLQPEGHSMQSPGGHRVHNFCGSALELRTTGLEIRPSPHHHGHCWACQDAGEKIIAGNCCRPCCWPSVVVSWHARTPASSGWTCWPGPQDGLNNSVGFPSTCQRLYFGCMGCWKQLNTCRGVYVKCWGDSVCIRWWIVMRTNSLCPSILSYDSGLACAMIKGFRPNEKQCCRLVTSENTKESYSGIRMHAVFCRIQYLMDLLWQFVVLRKQHDPDRLNPGFKSYETEKWVIAPMVKGTVLDRQWQIVNDAVG